MKIRQPSTLKNLQLLLDQKKETEKVHVQIWKQRFTIWAAPGSMAVQKTFLDLKTTQKRELSFAKLEHFDCAVLGSTGIDSRVERLRSFRSWKDSQLLTNLTGLLECTRSSWCIHQLHPWITPMSVKDTTARDNKKGPEFFSSVRCFFFQIGLWKLFSHDMKASFEGFEVSRCCMT